METKTTYPFQPDNNTDFEVRSLDSICVNESQLRHSWYHNFKYTAAGIFFGIVFVKSEILSWFRIQEMFRLISFHMYGIIGTAIITGIISVALIKRFAVKTIYGEPVVFHRKKVNKGQIIGGLIFGFGWAMTGACPGPMFAQLGYGALAALVLIASAIAGTWLYGYFKDKLPH